jgi:hypothetical protein
MHRARLDPPSPDVGYRSSRFDHKRESERRAQSQNLFWGPSNELAWDCDSVARGGGQNQALVADFDETIRGGKRN